MYDYLITFPHLFFIRLKTSFYAELIITTFIFLLLLLFFYYYYSEIYQIKL